MVAASAQQLDVRFPESDPEEEFIFYFRQHWVRLVWPLFQCLFFSAIIIGTGILLFGFIVIDDVRLQRALFLALSALFAGAHFNFLVRLYRYFLYIIIVTDRKIHRMKKSLIAFDDHESIDLRELQDVRKTQHGIIQNLLGFGSIVLDAQNSQMKIHFVPRISRTHDTILRIKEKTHAHKSRHMYNTPA